MKYSVTVDYITTTNIIVEAPDEEAAEEAVNEMIDTGVGAARLIAKMDQRNYGGLDVELVEEADPGEVADVIACEGPVLRNKFADERELLRFFEDGGCLLDTEERTAYISDIGGEDERFYGIMVAGPIPDKLMGDPSAAIEYALGHFPAPGSGAPNRMDFMYAPGEWFGELAKEVIDNPEQFLA